MGFKNNKLFYTLFAITLAISLIGSALQFRRFSADNSSAVIIDGNKLNVEIADNPAERTQGLSDRASLPADNGMLFVFADKRVRSFWMKNMHFPLDIIWVDGDKIIGINKNLPPEGETPANHYQSPGAADYVLEVNAGWADEHGVEAGDVMKRQ